MFISSYDHSLNPFGEHDEEDEETASFKYSNKPK